MVIGTHRPEHVVAVGDFGQARGTQGALFAAVGHEIVGVVFQAPYQLIAQANHCVDLGPAVFRVEIGHEGSPEGGRIDAEDRLPVIRVIDVGVVSVVDGKQVCIFGRPVGGRDHRKHGGDILERPGSHQLTHAGHVGIANKIVLSGCCVDESGKIGTLTDGPDVAGTGAEGRHRIGVDRSLHPKPVAS